MRIFGFISRYSSRLHNHLLNGKGSIVRDLKEEMLKGDIKSAMNFVLVAKWSKVILAVLVIAAYFTERAWLTEIIVVSVVFSLIVPLGFFDVFIQKLLEYNTQKVEERQILNAQEANEKFEKICRKVGK